MVKAGSHGIDAAVIISAVRISWNRENSRGDITILDSLDPSRLRDAGNAPTGTFRKLYNLARIFPLPRLATSGADEICVRPESVEISSGAPAAGAMTGRVADVVTLGAFRHVVLDLVSGDRIISACPNRPDIAFARGQEISVSIPPEACVLFAR
ncbi:TOBE domain-containing protein [Rhizobium laguerreae]|uniref:TOBE domain-containing protein n=1 Tax=Rhizobium laguerreae TaxID=1076926 RepID=UPI0035E44BE5